ncbi:MAG: hypothetical protein IKQ12_01110 [Prevotella sp.]|nr:hypothetical protein [Prevotella sp.]MBR6138156.1 hypothetical protein [Prevotella sp.]
MAKKIVRLTEEKIREIVKGVTINILCENRNFERAKRAVYTYCNPQNTEDVFDIIHDTQRNIPYSRILKNKFLEGVIRLVYNEELDSSQQETINDILAIISTNAKYQVAYNGNFNGLYFEDLCFKFYDEIKNLINRERQESASQSYQPNNDYTIHKIDNYEDAMRFGQYTNWCISHSNFDYNTYTPHGETFYICLKNGFQNVPMERGENHPLDEYGLSMIAVSVRKNGRMASSTTRWNEAVNGGKILTPHQISQLIGKDFYTVFIPK